MAIFVMLNNFFHDFSVALLAACLLAIWRVGRDEGIPPEARLRLHRWFSALAKACWAWIIVGGAVRTWAYQEYEWLPAAGRGQVAALVLKHILLVSMVLFGVTVQRRLGRRLLGQVQGQGQP